MIALALIALPWGVAPLCYLLRRFKIITALLAGGTAVVLAVLAYRLPSESVIDVLGRPLGASPAESLVLPVLLGLLAVGLLFTWDMDQEPAFPAVALAATGLLNGALLISPVPLAVQLLALGGLVMTFVIQGERGPTKRGALVYLVMMVLAAAALLLAAWLAGAYDVGRSDRANSLPLVVLLVFGFGILLGGVPFHLWLSSLWREAPTMATAFVMAFFQPVAFLMLLRFLNRYPWLMASSLSGTLISLGGLTAVAGGLFAAISRDYFSLWGYAATADLGPALVGLGLGSQAGWAAAGLLLFNRSVCVLLAALGMPRGSESPVSNADLGKINRGRSWASIGTLVGGLGLSGIPLLGGFPGRWLLYAELFSRDPTVVYLLILGGLLTLLGYVVVARTTVKLGEGRNRGFVMGLPIILLILVSVAAGLAPQRLLQPLLGVLRTLAFLAT